VSGHANRQTDRQTDTLIAILHTLTFKQVVKGVMACRAVIED